MILRNVVFVLQLVERVMQFSLCFLIPVAFDKHFCAGFHDLFDIIVGKNPFFLQHVEQGVKCIPRKGSLRHRFLGVDFVIHSAVYGLNFIHAFKNNQRLTAKRWSEICLKAETEAVRGLATTLADIRLSWPDVSGRVFSLARVRLEEARPVVALQQHPVALRTPAPQAELVPVVDVELFLRLFLAAELAHVHVTPPHARGRQCSPVAALSSVLFSRAGKTVAV